jgi:nucleoside 2-deoxyribosyltransferase
MPFHADYKNSYDYGIKLALESIGLEHFKADNEIKNKDIWCKICKEIQICGIFLANISGENPNVMLELGLAYGLGKKVILVKDTKTAAISDLGAIEYIEYAHEGELQTKLPLILKEL